ncbi:hypothetical protein [Umezawaea sp. NPDC059074]|uniref:hypothetical protein n=1 Tax=Umezawaea sp. NPDC059074 TaxID=3346716 RepID=UPI0036B1EDBE
MNRLLAGGEPCRAIVIGALGRCGHGAERALHAAGLDPTRWDLIDNLPSLVPLESSTAVSADLLPHLRGLLDATAPWRRCADLFATKTTEELPDD